MRESFTNPSSIQLDQLHSQWRYLAIFIAIAVGLLVWLPAVFTPLWGDDYFFLENAKAARLAGISWLTPFFSESNTAFWRPLSMDLPWRFIEDTLGGDPVRAHLLSAACWLISVMSVANLGYRLALALHWQHARLLALIAGLLFGFHGIHVLVLHWVSAINSAILVTFVAFTLTAWIGVSHTFGAKQKLYSLLTILSLWLALFSKEVAILLPVLMLLLSVFTFGFKRPDATVITTFIVCLASCLCWLYLFHKFTPIRYSAYEIVLGPHILKNGALLLGWLLNVPRESLRLLQSGEFSTAVIWIAACVIPMLVFIALTLKALRRSITLLQWLMLTAFCVSAYAPYFLLRQQSYEYYAAIALILPAIILAKGLMDSKLMALALALFVLSSSISIVGNRMLDYPSLIGRAEWAERQFDYLESHMHSAKLTNPLIVAPHNYHQFSAIEISGLAWRLGIPRDQIVVSTQCAASALGMLAQDENGDFRWKDCP